MISVSPASFGALLLAGMLISVLAPLLLAGLRSRLATLHADCCLSLAIAQVLAEPLDMQQLWRHVPYLAQFVDDLPVGKPTIWYS